MANDATTEEECKDESDTSRQDRGAYKGVRAQEEERGQHSASPGLRRPADRAGGAVRHTRPERGGYSKSLPVAYAREVCPEPVKAHLLERLDAGKHDAAAAWEALQLLKENGAEIYILAEIERQRGLALAALEQARPQPVAGEQLAGMLHQLDENL